MKKFSRLFFIMLMVGLAAFTGCNKQTDQATDPAGDEISALTDQAINGFDSQEVYSDETGNDLYMKDEGIPPDFLVEETDLEGNDTIRKFIRDHSFIECLRKLDLSEQQKPEIKLSIREYKECKEDALKRAKTIYRELLEKYKVKSERIHEAFKKGTISREEFKKLMTELKSEFRRELHSLQIKEKLHDSFKACFRNLLKDLRSVLTERQWNAFVECYKK